MSGDEPFTGHARNRAVTNLEFCRFPLLQPPVAIDGFHCGNPGPGLAAKGAGIHGQRPAHGAGDTRQKFHPGQSPPRGLPRNPCAGHAGLHAQGIVIQPFERGERTEGENHRAGEAAVAHQQVASQADPQQRLIRVEVMQEDAQVSEIRRLVETPRGPAGTPRGMPRHGFVITQLATPLLCGLRRHHSPAPRDHSRQVRCQSGGCRPDVAGTQRQQDVAVLQDVTQYRRQCRQVRHEYRVDLSAGADAARQGTAIGTADRRLASGIHLAQQQHVDRGKNLDEVIEQVVRTGIAMRLEHHHQAPPRPAGACGLQRRGNLARVVRIIVDQQHPAGGCGDVTHQLKTPPDTLESGQRPLHGGIGHTQLGGNGNRGQRVQDIVATRQVQGDCKGLRMSGTLAP